jgi:multidrug efflux pump subunit AcrA (membrane-fusion protein)
MPDVMDELSKPESPLSAEPPAEVAPGRSPVKFIALGMLVLALGIGAWAWFHFRDRVSSDDAQVEAHMTAVAPKIPGNVLEVLVKDNQAVKAGDILVRIDPRDYQARVDIARAALLQAQSQLHTAQTVVPSQTMRRNPALRARRRSLPMPWRNSNVPGWRMSRRRVRKSPWPRPKCAPNRRIVNAPRPISRA